MKNKNFKKENIIIKIHSEKGFSFNYSKKLVDDIINVIIYGIKNSNFILKNIGSFKLLNKKERLGRNPITGKAHIIKPRKSIKFTPSKNLINFNE